MLTDAERRAHVRRCSRRVFRLERRGKPARRAKSRLRVPVHRSWWLLRLESIGYMLVSALVLLALAFFVVLGPLLFKGAVKSAYVGSSRSGLLLWAMILSPQTSRGEMSLNRRQELRREAHPTRYR